MPEEKQEKVLKLNGKEIKIVPPEDSSIDGDHKKLSKVSNRSLLKTNYSKRKIGGKNKEKLNLQSALIILEAIRNGLPVKRTCALVNIAPPTLGIWLRKGQRNESEKYKWFYEQCLKAEADCENNALKVVQQAIEGGLATIKEKRIYNKKGKLQRKEVNKTINPPNWTAAMTLLERRYPDRWGRYDRLKVGEDPENPMVSKQLLLDFLVNYVGKDNSPIDIEGKPVSQERIENNFNDE